jgi:acetate kinase
VEGIGVAPHLKVVDAKGIAVAEDTWPAEGFGHDQATRQLMRTGVGLIQGSQIIGIGHRVVHGGSHYAQPTRVDHALLASLSELIPLAPLHQPHNLAPIETLMEIVPLIPQVACFTLHSTVLNRLWHSRSRCPDSAPKQVSSDMGFMAYPTNF